MGFHRAAGVPACCAQQQETSVWVPNSSPLAMGPQGSREVVPGQKSGVHPDCLAVMTPGGLRGSSPPRGRRHWLTAALPSRVAEAPGTFECQPSHQRP